LVPSRAGVPGVGRSAWSAGCRSIDIVRGGLIGTNRRVGTEIVIDMV
jgi:hypothetical protein